MTIRSLGLLALVAVTSAAELAVRDVHVGLATRPTAFDYEYTAPLISRSGSDSFDAGIGLEAGCRWSLSRPGSSIGLVVGSDLALDAQQYQDVDGLATTWARISAGIGWAPIDRWTLIAETGASYGRSSIQLPATLVAPAFDANGDSTGYDLRFLGQRQLNRRVAVSGVAGWMIAEHDLTTGSSDLRLEQAGWFVGVGLVWRFTDAPARLE